MHDGSDRLHDEVDHLATPDGLGSSGDRFRRPGDLAADLVAVPLEPELDGIGTGGRRHQRALAVREAGDVDPDPAVASET